MNEKVYTNRDDRINDKGVESITRGKKIPPLKKEDYSSKLVGINQCSEWGTTYIWHGFMANGGGGSSSKSAFHVENTPETAMSEEGMYFLLAGGL